MKTSIFSGISPKIHESSNPSKTLLKLDPNDQRKDATRFLRNYATQLALQVPCKFVTDEREIKDLYLLPALPNMTRKYVYDQYVICCRDAKKDSISFALWVMLWDWLCPNIITLNSSKRPEKCAVCVGFEDQIKHLTVSV